MVMVPFVEMEMRHRARSGARFTTYADGVGDTRVAALIDLFDETVGETQHKAHAQIGLSIPTGSITENDRTPLSMGNRVRLPYPMQIGSGTWDFLPALTYRGFQGDFGWGVQGRGEIRMNENHADYQQGNEYGLTAWGSYSVTDWLSLSLRADFRHVLNYRGRDPSIATATPMVPGVPLVPTADPGRRASIELDALLGANFTVPLESLHGLRFAVEAGIPVYQYLDGPGLENDYVVTVGVQYAFE